MFNRRSKLMKRFRILACLIAVLTICMHTLAGQTNAPAAQNSVRAATNGNAHIGKVHPNAPVARNLARGPAGVGSRTAYSRPTSIVAQRAVNLRPNYSSSVRNLNPSLAAMSARQSARTDNVQPVTSMLAKSDFAQSAEPIPNAQRIPRTYNLQQTRDILARRELAQSRMVTPNAHTSGKTLQPTPDDLAPHETQRTDEARHNWHGNKRRLSYSDASRCHRQWHDRNWWKQNFTTIVFVNSGYYFLDGGYWYPALGYDPLNSYYDYDGPIYTYGNLLPDEVIANVQVALQDAGYYFGPVTGSLNVETRAALANFQRDQGLIITGAIDQPTVELLGLY